MIKTQDVVVRSRYQRRVHFFFISHDTAVLTIKGSHVILLDLLIGNDVESPRVSVFGYFIASTPSCLSLTLHPTTPVM